MTRIEINGRTYEMDEQTADVLAGMMAEAINERSANKARGAMEFVTLAECFGRARRVA